MSAERDLLFGVLAVQLGFADPAQVMAAAGAWAANRKRPLPEHLLGFGDIREEQRRLLDGLVDQALALHDGDASRTLETFGGQRIVDRTFGGSVVLDKGEVVVSPPPADAQLQTDARPDSDAGDVTPEAGGRYKPKPFEDANGRTTAEIGRGGIGRVILAVDEHLGREVAIKELLPGKAGGGLPDPSAGASPGPALSTAVIRFLREARITGQLEHPNIVPVYELGRRPDGTLYYTMKIVRGRTLAQALDACESLTDRLGLLTHFVDLCQAVAYAHSRGVVHRDLKPENVMLGEFGETVVLDWGLAKTRDQEDLRGQEIKREVRLLLDASGSQTVAGTALGTPKYMSPEQAQGDLEHIDERSDVWSLGAVLFEILTGRPVFEGVSAYEVLGLVIRGQVPAVEQICPAAPVELAAVCRKALQRDRTARYPGAAELAREVSTFLTGGRVLAHDYQLGELLGRFARKNKIPLAITALAALLLTGLGIWNHLRVVDERNRAVLAETEAEARLGDSLREGARAAFVHLDLPEARARLRTSLQLADSLAGRGLWQQLTDSRLVWRARFGALAYGLAFSPDGQRLAVAANDGQVYLVDTSTAVADPLPGSGPQFLSVAFSPDGDTLAGGVNGGPVHLWDLSAGTTRRLVDQHEGVKDLAFSPDGRSLVTGSWEGTVRLWDLASGKQIARADVPGWAAGLAFDRDGATLYAGCSAGGVKVFDGADLKQRRTLTTPGTVGYIALSPDARSLAVSNDQDGRIALIDLGSGAPLRSLQTPASAVGALLLQKSRLIIGDGRRIRYIDSDKGRVLLTLEGHAGPVTALASVHGVDGPRLASAGTDVRLWQFAAKVTRRGHERKLTSMVFHPRAERLYTAGEDQTLRIWDTRMGRQTAMLKLDAEGMLAIHPAGEWLATTHAALKLWSPDSLSMLARLPSETGNEAVIAVDEVGARIAVAIRSKVQVFDTHTRKRIRQVTCADDVAALSLRGDRLLCAAQKGAGQVLVRDLSQGGAKDLTLTGHKGWVWSMHFDEAGERLVTAGNDGTARVWALTDGRQLLKVDHPEPIRDALLHPSEPLLVTASNDHTLRGWDLENGEERWRFRLWSSPELLAFDATGRYLAVANLTTVRLYDLKTGQAAWRGAALLDLGQEPPVAATTGSEDFSNAHSAKAWWADLHTAHLGRLSADAGTLCVVHRSATQAGDRLAMWDVRRDELIREAGFGHIREVVALHDACALFEVEHPKKFGRVLLLPRTVRVMELAHDATALAAQADGLLVAADGAALRFGPAGQADGRTPLRTGLHLRKLPDPVVDRKDVLGHEPTALARIGDRLVIGDARGRLEHIPVDPGTDPAAGLTFSDTFPAAVSILAAGPPGTVAAGFSDGHLGLWDMQTGVRLISAKINGPIRHLLLHGNKLIGLSEVGDSAAIDMGIFQIAWCQLLRTVWDQVPMEWHAGRAFRRPAPTDHRCAESTARPASR